MSGAPTRRAMRKAGIAMDTRDLDTEEWADFFDAFSRNYHGRPVTLELGPGHPRKLRCLIARHVPLIGITAEPRVGRVRSVNVTIGGGADEYLCHVVNAPRRVRVEQVSNGADEVITIDSDTDPTLRVDFSESCVSPWAEPAVHRVTTD
jgi:hypothetical protein